MMGVSAGCHTNNRSCIDRCPGVASHILKSPRLLDEPERITLLESDRKIGRISSSRARVSPHIFLFEMRFPHKVVVTPVMDRLNDPSCML